MSYEEEYRGEGEEYRGEGERICPECGEVFEPRFPRQHICSDCWWTRR